MANSKDKRQLRTLREETSKPKVEKAKSGFFKKTVKLVFAPFKVLRFIIPPYFKNSWRELKEVKWPNRKETWQLTVAVFIFSTIFGVLITLTDYGLGKLFKKILLKSG